MGRAVFDAAVEVVAAGDVAVAGAGAALDWATVAALVMILAFRRRRRRFGMSCSKSQTRSVSWETFTPIRTNETAIAPMDAPARRSASNTSRYGSNAAERRGRGLRNSAMSWASVCELAAIVLSATGTLAGKVCDRDGESIGDRFSPTDTRWVIAKSACGVVSVESWAIGDVALVAADVGSFVMPISYRLRAGRAIGGGLSKSKPEGLDVGVCAHNIFSTDYFSLLRCTKLTLPRFEVREPCFGWGHLLRHFLSIRAHVAGYLSKRTIWFPVFGIGLEVTGGSQC